MPTMTDSPTDTLATYITQASYSELPDEVVRKAKFQLLDTFGCGFGSSRTKLGDTAIRAFSQTSPGEVKLLGREETVNSETSAFLNAMLVNALDFDDCSAAGHVSSTLLGSLLALINECDVSGRDFLLAYVTGFEIAARIATANRPSIERFQEVWGLGTNQTFAAVVSAAMMRKLDKLQLLNAIGIAGASAPVPSGQKWGWDKRPLTWIKDTAALPAQIGVMSTTLAAAGFHGCKNILDGETGFWRMAASDQCDFDLMTKGLDTEFYLMGSSIKTYACCWFIHPALDAVRTVVNEHNLKHEDIAKIDVWSVSYLLDMFEIVQPEELVDAQFSLPYCVAVSLLGFETGPDWYDEALFTNSDVLSIGSRVKIHPDSKCDEIFHTENLRISARVEITTSNGEKFEASAASPRGTPMYPLSEDEIIEKYLALAVPAIGAEKAQALKEFVINLEEQQQVSTLSELISA